MLSNPPYRRAGSIRCRTDPGTPVFQSIHNIFSNRSLSDTLFKFLTYQFPSIGYWPTVALTGDGELGFDSGEGA